MAPTHRAQRRYARPFTCNDWAASLRVFVGDPAPEEPEEIGPDAAPEPPPSWTRAEYEDRLLLRGITDRHAPPSMVRLGVQAYLTLLEEHGLLEKRPNISEVTEVLTMSAPDSLNAVDLFGSRSRSLLSDQRVAAHDALGQEATR
ncbi:hypothetical protein [Nonomuraea endophytica]|uniref:hypothetical protein n=1 Tax=Nonomuraea endophytica TaxID=714136 RepID=UPI0037CC9BB2